MVTKEKVTEVKWLCAAFFFIASEFITIGIVIHSDMSHPHLLGRVSIAGGTYQISRLLKYMVGVIAATAIPISMALNMIASRERIRREAVHKRADPEGDVSVWPPAPRIDQQ